MSHEAPSESKKPRKDFRDHGGATATTSSLASGGGGATYTYEHEKYDIAHEHIKESTSQLYKHGAVACDSVVASQVGRDILEQGGSAVDAAIGALLCNGLLNAQSMGIGGGFFMLYYEKKTGRITVLDARETAPLASTVDMFLDKKTTSGGLAVAVPGEIKGYWQAHQLFGTLKWSDLFKPAISMCNNGFVLPRSQAHFLKHLEDKIKRYDSLREVYFNYAKNELYTSGSVLRRPKLAKTLDVIAREGESAFYNGSLTDAIVEEIQSTGGIITNEDMKAYECRVKEPVSFKLRTNNLTLHTVPPPSCGILLNFMLGVLDCYGYDEHSLSSLESTSLFYHRFIEASKFAFGLRSGIGDDQFYDSLSFIRHLSDPNILYKYRERIKDRHVHPVVYYGSSDFTVDHGTSHTCVVAPNGDACAVTSSVNLVFGSKVMGHKTDIIYNNQMDDFSMYHKHCNSFSVPTYPINFVAPGKRPVSSMCPIMVVDDDKNMRLLCGGSGGTRIISSTALTVFRNIVLKRNLAESVDGLRVHHQLFPDEVLYEEGFNPEVLSRLAKFGHEIHNFGRGGSVVQAIARTNNDLWHAVTDHRKGGAPSGF